MINIVMTMVMIVAKDDCCVWSRVGIGVDSGALLIAVVVVNNRGQR